MAATSAHRDVAGRPVENPLPQRDIGRRALQQVGRDGGEAAFQYLAGARHRPARHGDGARRIGSGGIRRHRGVAKDDGDGGNGNAEHLVGDLRERRFHALAVGMHADADLEPAVRREAHRRLLVPGRERIAGRAEQRRAVRGHLDVIRKADTDEGVAVRLRLPGADRRQVHALARDVEASAIVAAVVGVAGHGDERHGRVRHQVLAPDVARLAPDRARHRIDRQLDREADAGARDPAIRNDRRLVGGNGGGA